MVHKRLEKTSEKKYGVRVEQHTDIFNYQHLTTELSSQYVSGLNFSKEDKQVIMTDFLKVIM